jgi:hypothetical protein
VPLIGALLHGAASQGHFVRPDFLHVSVGLDGPLALSLLAGVSIVMLVFTFSSPASQAVAGLLAGTVLYQLASVTSLLFAHNQLQPHRAVTMMWAAFGAAVPVAVEGLRIRAGFVKILPPALLRRLGAVLLALSLPAIFVLGAAQGSDLAAGPYARAAYKRPNLAPAKAMTSFITQVSGKEPRQLTVLTGYRPILVTEPFYGFLPLRARYAHPEAHLPQRISVLRAAAACPDSACATGKLTRSRFGAIDAMVLARTPAGYRVQTQADGFPNPRPVTITFRRNSFAPSAWTRHDFGPYTAFARPRAR